MNNKQPKKATERKLLLRNNSVAMQITPIMPVKKTNGVKNGVLKDVDTRGFANRFEARYKVMPEIPAGLPEPTFSESSNKILKERYLLKGGNLEVAETVSDRFWHIAYDIASADFDFGAKSSEVMELAKNNYSMMVKQEFLPNSPTIMNSGKANGLQYSACFVLPVEDSLPGIFDAIKYAALIHQTGGGCIGANARLWSTFCGIEPIETLFARATVDGRSGIRQGSGVAYDVSDLNIKTASMNPKTGETGLKKITHVWKYNVPEDQQVVVKTVEGTTVQTSSWHPFMALRGAGLVEVEAKDLVKGDVVVGPSDPDRYWPFKDEKRVNSLTINSDLAWLIGFTLGDGSFGYVPSLRQYRVRWFSGVEDVLKRVLEILKKLDINVSIQKDKRGLLSVATLNQRFVHDLLEACGLEKFGAKDSLIRVPETIAKSPLEQVRAFLAGLLDSDGYVAPDGSPSYCSVSKSMSEDLAALVSLLGYQPSVKVREPYGKGKLKTYSVQFCPLPQVNKLASEVSRFMASVNRRERLHSLSRKQTALPLNFRVWRDKLTEFKLVKPRFDKLKGSGPLSRELNYWSAHQRISRDDLLKIAQVLSKFDKQLGGILERVAQSGQEIKVVEKAATPQVYYDLSVEGWNTYAAGTSGMMMIHNTGFAFSRLRPGGSVVRTTGGVASGPVSFLRVFNAATESIKQGGTRRGANMGILRVDHPDVMEFIRCKAELDDQNGPVFEEIAPLLPDDNARSHFKTLLLDRQISNFNISVAITDKFMEALKTESDFDLIDPSTKEVYGKLNSKEVFDEIVDRAWHTGDPGLIFIDRINNSPANPAPELETIESTNPCVTADTWIQTSQGSKQVQELIGTPFFARVDGKDYLSEPEGFFKTGEKEVIKLETFEGYSLRLTSNHLIKKAVLDNPRALKYEWCEAGSLKPGDYVVLNNHRQNADWKGQYNYQEGYLTGLLVGDGTLKSDKAVLSVWNYPVRDGAQSVMQFAMDSALSMPHRSDFSGWMTLPARNEYRMSLGYIKQLAHNLGMFPGHKTITPEVEKTSSDFYKGFLRGFFDADGSVQLGTQGRINVRLAQSDLACLEAVQRMLLRLGIVSKIYQNRRVAGTKLLPDGKGGHKEYPVKAQHELVISRDNLDVFNEVIGFANSDKSALLTKLLKSHSKRGRYNEKFVAQVKVMDFEAKMDVYDVQIPGINAFDANGIIAHNCGEQPLAPWDACNLGSINLGKFILPDQSDVDWDQLRRVTRQAVHFLDNVVQTNPYTLEPIYEEVHRNRRIGLGVMGWADLLFRLKIAYDSDEAIALAEKVMKFINDEGHKMSEELAEVRGPFPNWAHSIYKQSLPGDPVRNGKPLRNGTVTTIAPTGTISIIGDCSSGIEPVFALAYIHRAKGAGDKMRFLTIANKTFTEIAQREGFWSEDLAQKVMEHGSVKGLDDVVPEQWQKVFTTAPLIHPDWHVKMQSAFQKNVDNGVSKTINLPNDATHEDVRRAYMMAWETGCMGITVYRDGSKTTQVLNVSSTLKPAAAESTAESASQDSVVSRPMILRGRTYKIQTPVGEGFITINRDEKDQPFEVFITVGKGGMHTMADAEAIGRLISLSLKISRSSGDVDPKTIAQKISSQLRGIGGASHIGFGKNRVMSLADAVAKAIAEDLAISESGSSVSPAETAAPEPLPLNLTEQTETSSKGLTDDVVAQQLPAISAASSGVMAGADLCPECGQATFVREDGCQKCYSCGYSKC